LQLIHRLRLPAFFCALLVLACAMLSQPYTNMGVDDDGPYILMARTLATTGHFVYNGWAAPMIGWQLYLGAALIKLFGFSFTTVRFSTVLVATVMAFVIQRTLVHAGITERNATLGTLTFVLSPLYLMLSTTYMTDIYGLFAVVLCLYGCLRALQSSTDGSSVAWLCFAIVTNVLCGTSRQVAWLGILVMLPSTLWLLRAHRRVVLTAATLNLAAIVFIFACMQWLKRQPYSIPEHLLPGSFPALHILAQLASLLLNAPFLLVALTALFVPQVRKAPRSLFVVICIAFFAYFFLASYPSHLRGHFLLEPTIAWQAGWIGVHGIPECVSLLGKPPLFLNRAAQIVLTIACFGGLAGLLVTLFSAKRPSAPATPAALTWTQLGVLLGPFTLVYILLLIPRATEWLFDRYLLLLLVVGLLCLVRYYQDRVHPRLPLVTVLLIALLALWSIAVTHNTFSLYRARVTLAAELNATGVPDTAIDNGWEYNLNVELRYADHINFPTIAVPAHVYMHVPPPPPGICPMDRYDYTPHLHALYGVSFQPDVCYGPAPFAPVHYSRWLAASPGTLYAVNYLHFNQH
jgi:TRAP-type C4-dicarboxylate transport system permease small subunit